jgi:anaerobic magnesium-protoporphyrin IX monomethyl ester cyclase
VSDLTTYIRETFERKTVSPVSPSEQGKKPGVLNIQDFPAATGAPVVLFFPQTVSGEARSIFDEGYDSRAPLSVLALAGPLEQAGYRVSIVDAIMEDDAAQAVLRSLEGALCLGVSCTAGYQLYQALEITRLARAKHPSLPIIWGGWFPSMLTKPTIEDRDVDIVVRGQGEATFLELVYRLSRNLPIDDVRGIAYKKEGRVIFTPERTIVDINTVPPLPYHLIDVNAHLEAGVPRDGLRTISYFSSYGCPYQCTFCSNDALFGPRWYALSPERTVDDIEHLVRTWGVTKILFDDANYFVSAKRVREISELIVERGLGGKFVWEATGTSNVICKFDEETLRLLKQSGCSGVFIGAETGSRELMEVFKKPITGEQTVGAAAALGRYDIVPHISFVIGVPGEPEGALDATLDLVARIYRANPKVNIFLFYFTPLPGVRLANSPQTRDMTLNLPQDLTQWSTHGGSGFYSNYGVRDLLSPAYRKKAERAKALIFLMYRERVTKKSFLAAILKRIALFRLQHKLFGFPVLESRIWRYARLG